MSHQGVAGRDEGLPAFGIWMRLILWGMRKTEAAPAPCTVLEFAPPAPSV